MSLKPSILRIGTGAAILFAIALGGVAQVHASEVRSAGCSPAAPEKPKKKGLGLGGLLGAAKRAGVGNVLGSGILGDSRGARVAGAVAGTAVEVTDGGSPMGALAGVGGSGRVAQAVGAAAGTAVELARQAPSGCEAAN